MEEPKFVLAYLFLTHTLFVYDQYGHRQTENQDKMHVLKKSNVNMLLYANTQYDDIISTILRNSETDLIIITQADKGLYFERLNKNHYYFNYHFAIVDELKQQSYSLNTYHLPENKSTSINPSITLVNTFRLNFNLYFGENYPLLEDKIYAQESFRNAYNLFEITDKVTN